MNKSEVVKNKFGIITHEKIECANLIVFNQYFDAEDEEDIQSAGDIDISKNQILRSSVIMTETRDYRRTYYASGNLQSFTEQNRLNGDLELRHRFDNQGRLEYLCNSNHTIELDSEGNVVFLHINKTRTSFNFHMEEVRCNGEVRALTHKEAEDIQTVFGQLH